MSILGEEKGGGAGAAETKGKKERRGGVGEGQGGREQEGGHANRRGDITPQTGGRYHTTNRGEERRLSSSLLRYLKYFIQHSL